MFFIFIIIVYLFHCFLINLFLNRHIYMNSSLQVLKVFWLNLEHWHLLFFIFCKFYFLLLFIYVLFFMVHFMDSSL